jgi:hypothetical protein
MNLLTYGGSSNYHSLQFQATLRPTTGIQRSGDVHVGARISVLARSRIPWTARRIPRTSNNNPGHTLRTNGTFELPMGPNKLLFGNTSGALARALERWQAWVDLQLNSGYPVSITAPEMLYGNGVPDIVYLSTSTKSREPVWGIRNGSFLEGRLLRTGDVFVKG